MAKKFYYQIMGETFGPMTGVELRDRALAGDVSSETLVRIDDGDWVLAGRLSNLFDDRGRVIGHEAIQGVIPDYADYLKQHQARNDQRQVPQQLLENELAESALTARGPAYRLLVVYGFLCEAFGIIGIFLTIIFAASAVFSFFRQGGSGTEFAVLRAALVGCSGLLLTSVVVAAFGRLVIALVDLVRQTRQNGELLQHSLRNQERLMVRVEQLRES